MKRLQGIAVDNVCTNAALATTTTTTAAITVTNPVATTLDVNVQAMLTPDSIPAILHIYKNWHVNNNESLLANKMVIEATKELRRMLTVTENPPVEEILEADLIPFLVKFLSSDIPMLMFESAWVLTNISSTKYTNEVVRLGAVPPLSKLLFHDTADLREQSAWCLGNMAGDSDEIRYNLVTYNNEEIIKGL